MVGLGVRDGGIAMPGVPAPILDNGRAASTSWTPESGRGFGLDDGLSIVAVVVVRGQSAVNPFLSHSSVRSVTY